LDMARLQNMVSTRRLREGGSMDKRVKQLSLRITDEIHRQLLLKGIIRNVVPAGPVITTIVECIVDGIVSRADNQWSLPHIRQCAECILAPITIHDPGNVAQITCNECGHYAQGKTRLDVINSWNEMQLKNMEMGND